MRVLAKVIRLDDGEKRLFTIDCLPFIAEFGAWIPHNFAGSDGLLSVTLSPEIAGRCPSGSVVEATLRESVKTPREVAGMWGVDTVKVLNAEELEFERATGRAIP